MKRLGVNIDHIATLRNARGEKHPNPVFAAKKVIKLGADSVTIHLREDRRHINDLDTKEICALNKVLVNLEVSMNSEIIKKALRYKPNYICIVPESEAETSGYETCHTLAVLVIFPKKVFFVLKEAPQRP